MHQKQELRSKCVFPNGKNIVDQVLDGLQLFIVSLTQVEKVFLNALRKLDWNICYIYILFSSLFYKGMRSRLCSSVVI